MSATVSSGLPIPPAAFQQVHDVQIHLVPDGVKLHGQLAATVEQLGMTLIAVDMTPLRDVQAFTASISQKAQFPYGAADLDVLVSLLADLEWIDNERGYVLLLEHADRFAQRDPEGFKDIVDCLVNVCDRWQTGERPFHVVLSGDRSFRALMLELMAQENAKQEQAARLPWLHDIHTVKVRDYG